MNEAGYRAARHESHHVAAATSVGWTVTGASRTTGWEGVTQLVPRLDGNVRTRAEELGVILVCPMLVDPIGSEQDLAKLSELVRSGISLGTVWSRAEMLMRTPAYRHHRNAIEHALTVRPRLSGEEIAELL